ncbi:Hrf1 family protein [Trypanosoma grayi]|uniref:Hrf1 family protein n=1 Tax=Trypanosoma grayi TaxID=71804 RepID=UPI0004F449FB|nr:Hrf1 family protein [Trypanosoma grayi]KEG07182.1 Hrf1 family protein [Trypanosoma grayi]
MMLQMGLQYGQSVLQGGEQSFMRHLPVISGIRRYFRVDNQYVKGKLAILLFPFTRRFQRVAPVSTSDHEASGFSAPYGGDPSMMPPGVERSPTSATGGMYPAALPTNDLYAFDLYLPLMGAVTYVILSAFLHGLHHNSVTNEHLLSSASSLVFWLLFEVVLLKVASYVLRLVPDVSVLDLVALCGYKYITVCLIVLIREVVQLESDAWYIGFFVMYALISNGFFVATILMRMHQREGRTPSNARLLAYGAACLQVPLVLWLALKPFR